MLTLDWSVDEYMKVYKDGFYMMQGLIAFLTSVMEYGIWRNL